MDDPMIDGLSERERWRHEQEMYKLDRETRLAALQLAIKAHSDAPSPHQESIPITAEYFYNFLTASDLKGVNLKWT